MKSTLTATLAALMLAAGLFVAACAPQPPAADPTWRDYTTWLVGGTAALAVGWAATLH